MTEDGTDAPHLLSNKTARRECGAEGWSVHRCLRTRLITERFVSYQGRRNNTRRAGALEKE
jgi:hypothetical protein